LFDEEDIRNAIAIAVQKLDGSRPLGRHRRCMSVDWINLAGDKSQ
jgi:hypothetical protein